jgi:hypothetical protein
MIGKPNNFKLFGSNTIKVPKLERQNRPRSPMTIINISNKPFQYRSTEYWADDTLLDYRTHFNIHFYEACIVAKQDYFVVIILIASIARCQLNSNMYVRR